MSHRHRTRFGGPGAVFLAAVAAVCLLVVLVVALRPAGDGPRRALPAPAAPGDGRAGPPPEWDAPEPVRVRVPAIGVDAALSPLVTDASRALVPPVSFVDAGWWQDGPEPGEAGPAVVVGHLDSDDGPAVFAGLTVLEPGDAIEIGRADGSTARFTVDEIAHHAKDAFPTDRVYGPTPGSQLRLVTCGGAYDPTTRSYGVNTVVYATLASLT
ncbi:class F sortase [Streptomyces sp. NPDC060194]|uniref:class F sortase n=1 Tax=Streptomyces sp. NPDC060194 TaxID=3347069 RepID=UPI00365B53CE